MESTIVVIPAEGDAPETEQWYIEQLKSYYRKHYGFEPRVLVFAHDLRRTDVVRSTWHQVRKFVSEHKNELVAAEIHAQGGLGAYAAYEFLRFCPERIARVFMIGGAPSEALSWSGKFFHCWFINVWYLIRWLVPFYADDPNPNGDAVINRIKISSTATMWKNPRLYRNQIRHIGQWFIPEYWHVPWDVDVYFVPNGIISWPKGSLAGWCRHKWWDNSYNDEKARAVWKRYGVRSTRRPGGNFSYYSMMPAEALLDVMNEVR